MWGGLFCFIVEYRKSEDSDKFVHVSLHTLCSEFVLMYVEKCTLSIIMCNMNDSASATRRVILTRIIIINL